MRVLMLTSSYPKYPGETTAPFIEEIAAGLVRRGHAIHVVLPYHPDLRRAAVERGVALHPYRYAPVPALNVWGYAEALRGDIGLKGSALRAAPFALPAGLLALLRQPGRFDLIHAHWVLPNGLPALLAAGLRRTPLVISLHGSDVYLAGKSAPFGLAARAIFRAARATTACSSDLRTRALRLGASTTTTRVVPYGVDTSAFAPLSTTERAAIRARLGVVGRSPLILTMSRLVYKKGLTHLLAAMPQIRAAHPNALLVLVGDGDLRNELAQQVRELGIGAGVRFAGQLDRATAALAIAAADVYVVPSILDQGGNIDGLPNALLEGMAAARPIVATRVAGIPDVISDGTHGLLVPPADPGALARAVSRLLADNGLARRLGAAARTRVERELTWDACAAGYEAAYRQALGR